MGNIQDKLNNRMRFISASLADPEGDDGYVGWADICKDEVPVEAASVIDLGANRTVVVAPDGMSVMMLSDDNLLYLGQDDFLREALSFLSFLYKDETEQMYMEAEFSDGDRRYVADFVCANFINQTYTNQNTKTSPEKTVEWYTFDQDIAWGNLAEVIAATKGFTILHTEIGGFTFATSDYKGMWLCYGCSVLYVGRKNLFDTCKQLTIYPDGEEFEMSIAGKDDTLDEYKCHAAEVFV